MVAKNPITGDSLVTKMNNENYRNGWEWIFGKKEDELQKEKEETTLPDEEEKL